MADPRKHSAAICVKTSAKTAYKIELFPAEQWQESAQGRFRLRVNRRWHDLPDGGAAYLDWQQIAALVAALASGQDAEPQPAPDLPRHSRVSVPNGRMLAGEILYDGTVTHSDPMRGYDGRW